MEISFKWPSFYFYLLCFQLCNGNPITPNSTDIDSHTKFLTGIISLLLTVCGLVFIAACLCCQRRQSFEKFRNSPVIGYSISDIEHGHVNPIANGGEFTIFSPLSPPHFNNNVFHANDEAKARTVEDSAESSYDIKSWFGPTEKDFPRNRLKYIKELGRGWFGKVVQGAAQDKDEEQSWTPVVVRILEATSSQTEKILFLQDAAIYRCSSHTNILSLVGRALESVPFLLLQEYCPQGDLKRYLQSNKADAEKLLTTEYPLIWCCQLTSAVKHIHENNIVHHDLASRNCQLSSNLTLKLGDYGLGAFRYPADYYQGLPMVPVRWCAPESLVCTQTTIQPKKITPEGNVWSLGVTMWEICECGEQPYNALNDDEVISQVLVSSGVTLGRPAYSALYTDYIYRLMKSCWTSVESRPTVSQIDLMLTDLLQVHRNTTYSTLEIDEFDKRWESCKPNTIIKTDHITEISINKSISPSLTNLHGSLDNLADEIKTSLDNEPKNDSLTSQMTSASDFSDVKPNSSLLFQRTTSSGSETEEENWRNKVERGAYTEKVRQKSRSVADLMVLTHVDYSESESETPLPSLDYRVNYKNVRLAPSNLENASMTFGSEGNLLSVQDAFQEELRKLKEERRDSLPFVPDTVSQSSFSNKELSGPSKLMQELNSTVDIQPANQVFNVYNVTIDNFSPIETQRNALDEIKPEMRIVDCKTSSNDVEGSENCDNSEGDSLRAEREHVKFESDCTRIILRDNEDETKEVAIDQQLNDEIRQEAPKNDCNETIEVDTLEEAFANITTKDAEESNSENVKEEFNEKNAEVNDTYIKEEEKITVLVTKESKVAEDDGIGNEENVKDADDSNPEKDKENAEVNEDSKGNDTYIKEEEKINVFEPKEFKVTENNGARNIENVKEVEDAEDSNSEKDREEFNEKTTEVNEDSKGNDTYIKEEEKINVFETKEFKVAENNGARNKENVKEVEDAEYSNSEKDREEFNEKNTEVNEDSKGNDTYIKEEHQINCLETKESKVPEYDAVTNKENVKDAEDQEPKTPSDISEAKDSQNARIFQLDTENMKQVPKLSDIILHSEHLKHLTDKENVTINEESDANSPSVNFDLSLDQDEAKPNSLTHSTMFTSTPFRKRDVSLSTEDKYSSLNLFSVDDADLDKDSLSFTPLNYSLETWDNFLGTTLDNHENTFDSFTSEPRSLMYVQDKDDDAANRTQVLNATYNLTGKPGDGSPDRTYDVKKEETEEEAAVLPDSNASGFENGGGWFLHPQPVQELCGNIEIQSPITDSYIGFGIDDEIMSAIRNELLSKLPHAQGANADRVKEEEEDWDVCERNEVFLRYNVYNTPLSPIPEESYLDDEESSPTKSPKPERDQDGEDWSGRTDTDTLTHDIESDSAHTLESPLRGQFNRHTPSQDSCCSNDTLFNLEELICVVTDAEAPSNLVTDVDEFDLESTYVKDGGIEGGEKNDTVDSESNNFRLKSNALDVNFQSHKQVAPLPSPEDNPWKQLPASLLNFNAVTPTTQLSLEEAANVKNDDVSVGIDDIAVKIDDCGVKIDDSCVKIDDSCVKIDDSAVNNDEGSVICDKEITTPVIDEECDSDESEERNLTFTKDSPAVMSKMATVSGSLDECEDENERVYENDRKAESRTYQNADEPPYKTDVDSYDEYVNIVNMENDRNRLECDVADREAFIDVYGHDEEAGSEDDNIYGILTDIRFTGPTDNQMMSTSFSENNDEQGWDSGSDSRSSSSGEFIWKEGEHEESLKALRAAPQDVLENIKPMEGIAEDVYEESDVSSSFTDDEETPEFVPSAWDKFAMPSKSALRSPEKTLNKPPERKSKGVWFKKQKYYCIYEYPKEPESPIMPSQDLWKPQTDLKSFADWEFDGEMFEQGPDDTTNYTNRTNKNCNSTNTNGDFFISSSAQPFHAHTLSSQFFPGGSGNWTFENATPDSGVEDVTPGSVSDSEYATIPTLKRLAAEAVAKKKLPKLRNNEVMGGLRHTRNKLKLDLPPSPSAFTADKPFAIEPAAVEHVIREKPAFTTFGKSRFMVQHVETPPDETATDKNVSFEALPYRPLNPIVRDQFDVVESFERSPIKDEEDDRSKLKVEVVRGEASLLDSGDEDSGIESASTLERKIANSQV